MIDFLLFRRMLMPILIQVIFWLGFIGCLVTGIMDIIRHEVWHGIEILIFGPIVVRIVCELLILFFRINETLTDIKNTVQEQEQQSI